MDQTYDAYLLKEDGDFPNNNELQVIVYQQVFVAEPTVDPAAIEDLFTENDWVNSWRNGLFAEHHYHSCAHEVLGIYSGWVKAQLGGPQGKMIVAGAGDVIVLPAGVSHKNIEQSPDFRVVGAYPLGQQCDMKYGRAGERPGVDDTIQNTPIPPKDPVFGNTGGAITELWRK